MINSKKQLEALWKECREYVCLPYQNNPDNLKAIESWFDALSERLQAGENLILEKNIITKSDGNEYISFSLNRQIHFSHDGAVLALPYMDSLESRKMVGVWLHDHGPVPKDDALAFFIIESRETPPWHTENDFNAIRQEDLSSEYVADACEAIRTTLQAPGLLGGKASQLLPNDPSVEIRYSTKGPMAGKMHRDRKQYDPNGDWFRILNLTIHGHGTTFGVGPHEDVLVSTPQGTVSSHTVVGAYHKASVDFDGRTVVLMATEREPISSSNGAYSIKPSPMPQP